MTLSNYFTPLTGAQRDLLLRLTKGGRFVRGADVRVAQNLAKRGLVALEDHGSLDGKGNADGERWYVSRVAGGTDK